MLSIENPPPDPSCSSQIPQLKNSSSCDERASHKLALPEVADLSSKPPLDHTPLSKFSIRDYVFTARSKDIKKNWPFSLKSLQLCLNHGVKDLLPSFHSSDTNLAEAEAKLVHANDHDASDDLRGVNRKLVDPCTDGSSCRFGGENDFPSTTTSISLSEIESVTANKLSSPQSEIDTSLEPSVGVRAIGPPVFQSHKTENATRLPGKKCRLIVKFGGNSDRSSAEDITSNSTAVSETMASKVCPVCKTFSSSSNTTLNAHIDQCLSGESTPKWTSDFKLTRHRIKPRKTRLMVDVYATAKMCTLEELDRRNGTNWATISSLPSRETDTLAEGRKQQVSQVHPEETSDVGAVYIDSNGTKVRILSKFSDAPVVSKGEGLELAKPCKGGKGNKHFSTKKKMKHASKHHKNLKLTPQSKKLRSYKAHSSQMYEDQEKVARMEVGREKNSEIQNFKSHDHVKPNGCGTLGTLGQWVCSKRTGLARKVRSKDGHQPLRCEFNVARDVMIESDPQHSSDSLVDRGHVQKLVNSFANTCSFAEVSDRMEMSSYNACDNERHWSRGRKRMRSSLVVPKISGDTEKAFSSMKQKTDNSSKAPLSIDQNRASLVSNRAVETHPGPRNCCDISPRAIVKPSRRCNGFSSKAMRLSSLKKKVSSASRFPGAESKFNVVKKSSADNKSQVEVTLGRKKEEVARHSELNEQHDLMQICTVNRSGRDASDEVSLGRSVSQGEEEMVLKRSRGAHQHFSHVEAESSDCSDGDSDDISDESDSLDSSKKARQADGEDTVADDSSPEMAGADSLACLNKSFDSEFHKLDNCMKTQSNSLQSSEDYIGPLCGEEAPADTNEPDFIDRQVMFSANNEVDDDAINGPNIDHAGTELNCEVGRGNSFLEVEPIPIPGPPGSFLPSPGGGGASSEEDFQGNSSLTAIRFQSSQDQHELVNGGSSDSPVSATSSISNSTTARYDLKCTQPLSAGSCTVQEKFGSGFLGVDVEPSVGNTRTVARTTSTAADQRSFDVDGGSPKVSKISIERGRLSYRNDDQPCCCLRKERVVTQCAALNYQESQLLRRRTMSSVTVPAVGTQLGGNLNSRPDPVDVRPEMFPSSSCLSSGSEKAFSPVMTSPLGPFPLHGRADCDSASPSAANPILRLMGKNLMVVNKDEDTSMPQVQTPSHAQNNHLTSQFTAFSGFYPANVRNPADYNSFQHFGNQGPVNFSRDTHGQPFDHVRMSNGFISQSGGGVVGPFYPNQHTEGGFTVSLEPHELEGEYILPTRQNRPKNRLNGSSICNLERVAAPQNRHYKSSSDAAFKTIKEIIIIDDGAESEGGMTCKVGKQVEHSRESHVSYGFPTIPNHASSHVNVFSAYQSQDAPLLGDGSHFHAAPSRRANTSPVRWSCTTEGPGRMLQRGPYVAVPPPTGHLRSALYYSPR